MNERLWDNYEPNLNTSETAKEWTETSPNNKLADISNKLDNYNWDDADELKELIAKREYKKFQSKIWITGNIDLDWKLWPKTFKYLCNYIKKHRRETHEIKQETKRIDRLKASIQAWELFNKSGDIKINKNAEKYISNSQALTDYEYQNLFKWWASIEQASSSGNCYFVAGLMEIANTQCFEKLMKASVRGVEFKDWTFWYCIRIPLWQPDGRDILINNDELRSARIVWSDGYKLLWIAYVKNRRPNNTEWNEYTPVTDQEYEKAKWWWTKEVLETLLWYDNIGFNTFWDRSRTNPLSKMSEVQKSQLEWLLKNYDSDKWDKYISVSSIWLDAKNPDSYTYTVWNNPTPIYHSHAYQFSSVDIDSNGDIAKVNLTNTYNDKYLLTEWDGLVSLTFPEFLAAFSYISVWKVSDSFMDTYWTNPNSSVHNTWESIT